MLFRRLLPTHILYCPDPRLPVCFTFCASLAPLVPRPGVSMRPSNTIGGYVWLFNLYSYVRLCKRLLPRITVPAILLGGWNSSNNERLVAGYGNALLQNARGTLVLQ